MANFVIETERLTKRFKEKVSVHELNLAVPKGEVYGFLGPNGAGKTTTIRMLLGLMRPSSGEVRLFGKKLSAHRMELMRRVGALVESPSYYGHLTGYENLKILAHYRNLPLNKIDEALEKVRLTASAHLKVKRYSLGMKQRLGIAAALLGDPELLILDEPTNGLDPAGMQEMRELIRTLPKETGVTVLLSSHLLSEIEQVAHRVGVIREGQLLFQGTLEELRGHSQPELEVEVDLTRDACRILKEQGYQVAADQKRLRVRGLEKEEIATVVKILVQQGFRLYQATPRAKSLEDLFLEMTGKEHSL